VKKKIFDACRMQVIRDLVRAAERGREVIEAFHDFPPSIKWALLDVLVPVQKRRSAKTTPL
jgi:hypothetical protein